MNQREPRLPDLPLDAWEATKTTLHLFLQIVGKIRMAMMPRKNHWWNLTLYVCPRGLTTHAIPFDDGFAAFEITLDLVQHRLEVVTSRGESAAFPLGDGLSVAGFDAKLFEVLGDLGIRPAIVGRPYDLPVTKPFSKIEEFAAYEREHVERFRRILLWVNGVFEEFSGRFYGKTCPVHLYWHHMDLTVTRFSGRRGPAVPADKSIAEKDAYSHEVVSFGFWVGDANVTGPAFYSYAYPAPQGVDGEPLSPAAASWMDSNGSPMALLMYDDVRRAPDPRAALLDFLESSYRAGAKLAGWDVEDLRVPPLAAL